MPMGVKFCLSPCCLGDAPESGLQRVGKQMVGYSGQGFNWSAFG